MKYPAIALGTLIAVGPLSSSAQSASDKVNAEALFGEGRRLMAAGNYRQACPKFEASLKLDPAVGAMLNLADCYEKNQQTASAWAEFREAGAAARASGSKDREDLARRRAAALEPKLSRLTIVAGEKAIQVTRDGSPVEPAALGAALPIDPGQHVIEATEPGKQKWSKTVDVGASAARVTVDIPPLTDEPASARATTPTNGATSSSSVAAETTPPPAVSVGTGSSQRTIAVVVGAVGLAGLGAGTYFGLKASSNWTDAKAGCTRFPAGCSDASVNQGNDAKSNGNLSTIAFAIGAAGVAGGIVLWVTAPKTKAEPQMAIVGLPGSVSLRGSF
jgi:hypothetical protein